MNNFPTLKRNFDITKGDTEKKSVLTSSHLLYWRVSLTCGNLYDLVFCSFFYHYNVQFGSFTCVWEGSLV